MKKYRFYTCDVFTNQRFGGNQLAVFPEAEGLSTEQMQKIAREFNFSETTFVFLPEQGYTRKVRIFTPSVEVPFAGHPNVGTAFVLLENGEFTDQDLEKGIVFEEKAGQVKIEITPENEMIKIDAPELLSIGREFSTEVVAKALSLAPGEIVVENHLPVQVSVGLPFIFVEVESQKVLAKSKINFDGFEEIQSLGVTPDVFVYAKSAGEFDICGRMFAPFDGVMEDPATGSANCALAGLLASLDPAARGDFRYKVAQGVEMGRASVLLSGAKKVDGTITSTSVEGQCVFVSEGLMHIE